MSEERRRPAWERRVEAVPVALVAWVLMLVSVQLTGYAFQLLPAKGAEESQSWLARNLMSVLVALAAVAYLLALWSRPRVILVLVGVAVLSLLAFLSGPHSMPT